MTREEAINKWIIPAIKYTWNEKKCNEILKVLEQEPCDIQKLKVGDTVLVKCKVEAVFTNSQMVMVATKDCDKGFDAYIDEIVCVCQDNIKQIKQEPCEDAISRQAVIVALDDRMSSLENVDMQIAMGFAKGIINDLPPVTPQPKPNIKALGEDMRICQKSITDKRVLIGFNMAVALCNKHLAESEVQDADSD